MVMSTSWVNDRNENVTSSLRLGFFNRFFLLHLLTQRVYVLVHCHEKPVYSE